jgi:GNAT superfamily N-acetyltransferase
VDAWVVERRTLCAVEGGQVVAAVHLHRYGAGPEVGQDYRGGGDIPWVLAWPEHGAAAIALLHEARRCLEAWGVPVARASVRLPVPVLGGVADTWPHLAEALQQAGFRAEAGPDLREAVWGGWLPGGDEEAPPPLPGLELVRRLTGWGDTALLAVAGGRAIGRCYVRTDLTDGGELPALAGWAVLEDLGVDEGWRGRGVGTWLLRHAIPWMRLAGCDRVVFAVGEAVEARGAGRLYRRFGWAPLTRLQKAWCAEAEGAGSPPGRA